MKPLSTKNNIQAPLVSVIVPVFNAENYIYECIESLINQTYSNLEIIIIDDGSNDKSLDVIQSFVDDRIKLYSRENIGLIATLNEALSYCAGRFIARMDADDISINTRIETQVLYLLNNKKVGLVGSSFIRIDKDGNEIGKGFVHLNHKDIMASFFFGNSMCHPSVMFNLDVVRTDLKYNQRYNTIEDFELWMRLSRKYIIHNLNEPLLLYRVLDSSITSQNLLQQKIKSLRIILYYLKGFKCNKLIQIRKNISDESSISELFLELFKLNFYNFKLGEFGRWSIAKCSILYVLRKLRSKGR